jgi:hypothetical protein
MWAFGYLVIHYHVHRWTGFHVQSVSRGPENLEHRGERQQAVKPKPMLAAHFEVGIRPKYRTVDACAEVQVTNGTGVTKDKMVGWMQSP